VSEWFRDSVCGVFEKERKEVRERVCFREREC